MLKRLTLLALTLCFMLGLALAALPITAQAAPARQTTTTPTATTSTGLTAQVLASQLYLRGRPSVTGGILTVVNWGATLTVLGRNFRATWVKVMAPDGTIGWVSVFWVRLSKNVRYDSLPIVS